MKKNDLKKLALLGIAGGVLMTQGTVQANETHNQINISSLIAHSCGPTSCSHKGGSSGSRMIAEADESTRTSAAELMTDDQLRSQLNEQGKQTFDSLNSEGKKMAIKLASRTCKGTNDCKGQNSCKTDEHSCAGKGSCAGTSACAFKDKNAAVKVAAQKQADKRNQTNSGSY